MEKIDYLKGFINANQLKYLAETMLKSSYRNYLVKCVQKLQCNIYWPREEIIMECLIPQLQDAKLIKLIVFANERRFFLESWQQKKFDDALLNGKPLNFVQDNHSKLAYNILRELHYQLHYPQGKLVSITARIVYDIIIIEL